MSKLTPIVPPPDARLAGELHRKSQLAMSYGAVHAVLCGLELRSIQKALKKSATRCTFDEWLENNEPILNFKRRMAFLYTALAEEVKNKLILDRDESLLALLNRDFSSLNQDDSQHLVDSVTLCVNGRTIRELLEEVKIARRNHDSTNVPPRNNAHDYDTHPPKVYKELIQSELIDRSNRTWLDFRKQLYEPVEKIGNQEILAYAQLPLANKRQLLDDIKEVTRDLERNIKAEEAMQLKGRKS